MGLGLLSITVHPVRDPVQSSKWLSGRFREIDYVKTRVNGTELHKLPEPSAEADRFTYNRAIFQSTHITLVIITLRQLVWPYCNSLIPRSFCCRQSMEHRGLPGYDSKALLTRIRFVDSLLHPGSL